MVRLVLFDIDGTLIHTGGAGLRAFSRTFASEFDLAHGTEKLSFAGRTDTGLVREFLAQHQVPATAANFQRFRDCYVFWLDHYLHELSGHACPGVWQLLHQFRSLPEPPILGLLTGNIRLGAEIKLRHYDLWAPFTTGAFGDDHEDRNQLARLARVRGSRRFGRTLGGDEILVIGDTPLDIACARAIGAPCLAVATGGASFEELQAHQPTWVVPSLNGVNARSLCAV